MQVTRHFFELHVPNCSFPQICTKYTPEILNTTCITSDRANILFNISAFNSEHFQTFCNETEDCHNIENINNTEPSDPPTKTETESQSPMQYITIIGGSCLGILILLVIILLLCLCKQMIAKRKHRNSDLGERGIPLDTREGQTSDSAVTQQDETQFHGNDNEGISLSTTQPDPPSVNFSHHTCTSSISAHSRRQNEDLSTCRSHHHLHDERCSHTSTINSGRDYSHAPSMCSNCSQNQLLQHMLLQQFHALGRNVHGYNPSFSVDSQHQIDSCEECLKTYHNYISQVVSSVPHLPSICHTRFPYDDTRSQFQTHSGHLTETKSRVSNDTGVCSTFSNPSERPQSHRPQKSTKSSGYFSHATSSVCDPLILNPHRKPGCNIPDVRTDIYQQRDQKHACDLKKNGSGTGMSRDSDVTTSRLCSNV